MGTRPVLTHCVIHRVSGWVLGLYLLAVCYLQGVQWVLCLYLLAVCYLQGIRTGAQPVLTRCVLFTGWPDRCSACTYSLCIIYRVSRWVLSLYLLAVCYLQGVQMGAQPILTCCVLFTGWLDRCSACTYSLCVIYRVSGWVLSLYLLAVCYLQGVRMGAQPVLTCCVLFTGCPDGCSACTYLLCVIYRVSEWVLGLYLLAVCYLQGVRTGARSVLTRCVLFTGCPNGCSVCTYSLCVIYRVSEWVLGLYLLAVCYLQGVRMGARSVLIRCLLFTGCLDGCLACTYSLYVIYRVSGQVLGLYLLAVCYLQGVQMGARPVLTRRPLVTRFARMDGVTLGTLRTRTTTGSSVSVRKASPTTSVEGPFQKSCTNIK